MKKYKCNLASEREKKGKKNKGLKKCYCHWQHFEAVKEPHSPSTSDFDCSFALVAPRG